MFDRIFGKYLVKTKRITKDQFDKAFAVWSTNYARLGTIAVAERLITVEQADEINYLQLIIDRKFGDIAVEEGYLSERQIAQLRKWQGNPYMVFVETLIDQEILTLEEVEIFLAEYQKEMGFSASDIIDLRSCDEERVVGLFLADVGELSGTLFGIAVRTLMRIIDATVYIEEAFLADEIYADNLVLQALTHVPGSMSDDVADLKDGLISGFAGTGEGLLAIANPFAMETFEEIDEDALDAVGEFTNCINGLFASKLSQKGVRVEMSTPELHGQRVRVSGKKFCVLPIILGEEQVNFIIATGTPLTVS